MPTSKTSSDEDNEGWHVKLVKMSDIFQVASGS